jgi:hypothetical protein
LSTMDPWSSNTNGTVKLVTYAVTPAMTRHNASQRTRAPFDARGVEA